jgi:hypothetical protein
MTTTGNSFDPVQWANIVIERWEEKIMQLGIGSTNTLINSFTQQVITDSNGNPELIVFAFEYYGKFIDMGVGRGTSLGEVISSNRTAKAWHNKIFVRELAIMSSLIADHYGTKATIIIKSSIEGE